MPENQPNSVDKRTESLKQIKEEVLKLTSSPLYEERTKNKVFPVIGEGSHYAKIMFIGEAPGRNEAATGRPFVGAAGKILDELLSKAGIERQSIYITNIVKDRPPFNRDPLPEEIKSYAPFLERQIDIIQPEIIVTLGRYAMTYIIERFGLSSLLKPIGQMRGQILEANTGYGPIKIIPLYHPAVAVYNRAMKETLQADFGVLKQFSD